MTANIRTKEKKVATILDFSLLNGHKHGCIKGSEGQNEADDEDETWRRKGN